MRNRLFVLFVGLAVACSATAHAGEPVPRQHPYLFFSKDDIPRLKERLKQPDIARLWENVQAAALRTPGAGRRRGGGPDVLCAGIAWQLTGDLRFSEAGVNVLMATVTNPRPWIGTVPNDEIKYCSLDMASRTLPVAYGYDLLYDAMTEEQRAQCRDALSKNVFTPFLAIHAVHDREKGMFTAKDGWWEWWTSTYFNWNSWINGDIGMAGMAMLDDVPEARQVVEMARESIRYMHPEFNQGDAEDGGWDEGPMYFQTALVHAVHFYAALERVMGTDDGFFELPGVEKAMDYFIDFTAPDGTWVNFSDTYARSRATVGSELYFLAARYDNPQYLRQVDAYLTDRNVMPFGVL